ncbi:MAG: ABC transporter permease [Flavobacteriales bacterium]|nr:ABC transporter permease [Flavobacteriales bacterium]
MSKVGLIIQREYFTRVKKKSFVLMTFLGPILMALLLLAVFWLGIKESNERFVLVIDNNHGVLGELKKSDGITYDYQDISFIDAQRLFNASSYTDILYIPKNITTIEAVSLLYKTQPSTIVIRSIERRLEEQVEELLLFQHKISKKDFYAIKRSIPVKPAKFTREGEAVEIVEEASMVGFVFGLMIYMFIFMYGVQVMRGVIEEKSNRIVEVIISSVKPFELMIGKIIGVGLVSFTQFLLWVFLTIILFSGLQFALFSDMFEAANVMSQMQMTPDMMQDMAPQMQFAQESGNPDNLINKIPWTNALTMFAIYFLGGYLLYSALFAAVGAAVDSETDTQQFMLPITMPLIFAYMISIFIVQNPDGPAAFWFSIIPFTSPIVMMVRFLASGEGGVPIWEIALSITLLILGFIFTTWLAGKIYRTGILMYGKKVTYKELWKWLSYKG